MIKRLIFLLFAFSFLIIGPTISQKFSGTWQGIYIQDTTESPQRINAIYLKFKIINGLIDATCRIEPYQSNNFGVYSLNGTLNNNTISLNFSKKIKEINLSPGIFQLYLEFNTHTGYLFGTILFKDQKESRSQLVLYQKDFEWNETTQNGSHLWVDLLQIELKKGVSSPKTRKEELKSFEFQSIYFDYDLYTVKMEYTPYLKEVVKVLNSHSDLRLKITGHTDGDGSNTYNLTLSKNRANALIEIFKSMGIEPSRIVIDFKGEDSPVDSNETEEGKQHNRRVEFEFI